MAEVLVEYTAVLAGPGGRSYTPRACGRVMDDGRRWEGWIEFLPTDSSPVLRTARETVQPNLTDLRYWATGLTAAYLEGALDRALEPPPAVSRRRADDRPPYDGPAPESAHVPASPPPPPQHAILDPFKVYRQGEDILRQELTALAPPRLREIIREYRLLEEEELDLEQMSRATLGELIVSAVRKRAEEH